MSALVWMERFWNFMPDLSVLWKHYSSWILYAIIALGGAQQAGIQIDGLPKWICTALAICALVAKTVPQGAATPPKASA
jgi:hypothetical protein